MQGEITPGPRDQLRSATERTHKPYMILDPQSELFHSSTCLQVLSGHVPLSLESARARERVNR